MNTVETLIDRMFLGIAERTAAIQMAYTEMEAERDSLAVALAEAEERYRALLVSISLSRPCHPGEPAYEFMISKSRVDEGFVFLDHQSRKDAK